MTALDAAARTLADRVLAQYVQPNEELVVPRMLRRDQRNFWDAMAHYQRIRQTQPEDPMDILTYDVEVTTADRRRATYTVRRLRSAEVLRSAEEHAQVLLGRAVRELPLPAPGLEPDAVITEIRLSRKVGGSPRTGVIA